VINTALKAEMAEHLGFDKHDPAGRNGKCRSRLARYTALVLTSRCRLGHHTCST